MSDHSCPVVPVVLSPHPNADKLAMVNGILGGYNCGVNKVEFQDVDRAAFIPPDSLIPVANPAFAFLAGAAYKDPSHPYFGFARITVKRFRGLYSDGLLVKVPAEFKIGDDAAEYLGVMHYEPIEGPASMSADAEGVDGFGSKYDIENLKRHMSVFQPGDLVVATEKIHGCNSRYMFDGERFWCGSRSHWKRFDPTRPNAWWAAKTEAMEALLRSNPSMVLFGEVYGKVQAGFPYDADGEFRFIGFDLRNTNGHAWVEHDEMTALLTSFGIPVVPELYRGPFDMDKLCEIAEGNTSIGTAPCREGVVVKSIPEKYSHVGRHQLKLISNRYLELK